MAQYLRPLNPRAVRWNVSDWDYQNNLAAYLASKFDENDFESQQRFHNFTTLLKAGASIGPNGEATISAAGDGVFNSINCPTIACDELQLASASFDTLYSNSGSFGTLSSTSLNTSTITATNGTIGTLSSNSITCNSITANSGSITTYTGANITLSGKLIASQAICAFAQVVNSEMGQMLAANANVLGTLRSVNTILSGPLTGVGATFSGLVTCPNISVSGNVTSNGFVSNSAAISTTLSAGSAAIQNGLTSASVSTGSCDVTYDLTVGGYSTLNGVSVTGLDSTGDIAGQNAVLNGTLDVLGASHLTAVYSTGVEVTGNIAANSMFLTNALSFDNATGVRANIATLTSATGLLGDLFGNTVQCHKNAGISGSLAVAGDVHIAGNLVGAAARLGDVRAKSLRVEGGMRHKGQIGAYLYAAGGWCFPLIKSQNDASGCFVGSGFDFTAAWSGTGNGLRVSVIPGYRLVLLSGVGRVLFECDNRDGEDLRVDVVEFPPNSSVCARICLFWGGELL